MVGQANRAWDALRRAMMWAATGSYAWKKEKEGVD